jgi:hypothetical protein
MLLRTTVILLDGQGMGRNRIAYGILVRKPEKEHQENQDLGEWIVLK